MLRMTESRWVWAALFCLAFAGGAASLLGTRKPLVSEANLSRINVGMSRAEVEAILGKPPAEPPDCAFPLEVLPYLRTNDGMTFSTAGTTFYCEKRLLSRLPDVLVVSFDDDSKVDNSGIVLGDKPSLWERLCDRVAELRASVGW
jgi:SmpA / OmlA family